MCEGITTGARAKVLLLAAMTIAAQSTAGCGSGGGAGGGDADTGVDTGTDTSVDTTEVPDGPDTADGTEGADAEDGGCASAGGCEDLDPCTSDSCDTDTMTCVHVDVDADGDGYAAAAVGGTACGGNDCDDANGDAYPGADLDCAGGLDLDCDDLEDADEDGDGWIAAACGGDDCDDASPGAFPGSTALGCDLDMNCNGETDGDDDGDGWDAIACGGDDCDDGDDDVHPTAPEMNCDGIDDDCDGVMSPYEDPDQDGFATPECVAAGEEADCDGGDAAVHPGAAEACDTVDDDCDGTWADGGADDDGDGRLDASCGGDDCDDACATCAPGMHEICDGLDNDCSGAADDGPIPGAEIVLATTVYQASAPEVAWTGSEFGLAWGDSGAGMGQVFFARVSPAGSMIGSAVRVSSASGQGGDPDVAWTGSEFGVAWEDASGGAWDIHFRRVSPAGATAGAESILSALGGGCWDPGVVWTGSEFGVVFQGGGNHLYCARASGDGAKIGSDVPLTDPGFCCATGAATVWTGSELGVAWDDIATSNFVFARFTPLGSRIGPEIALSGTAVDWMEPGLAWTGSGFAAAWMDDRFLDGEIMMASLSPLGAKLGSDVRVSDSAGVAENPSIAWTGSSLLAAWDDDRDAFGHPEIYLSAMTVEGALTMPGSRITEDPAASRDAEIAWSGSTLGVAWTDSRDGLQGEYFMVIGWCP